MTHGTNARYVYGCRCDACREAHSVYEKRRRDRMRAEKPSEVSLEDLMASAAKKTAVVHVAGRGDVEVRL